MQIIGYCIHDNKQYVVFTEYKKGTRLYNFINDTLVAESTVLGH